MFAKDFSGPLLKALVRITELCIAFPAFLFGRFFHTVGVSA